MACHFVYVALMDQLDELLTNPILKGGERDYPLLIQMEGKKNVRLDKNKNTLWLFRL